MKRACEHEWMKYDTGEMRKGKTKLKERREERIEEGKEKNVKQQTTKGSKSVRASLDSSHNFV